MKLFCYVVQGQILSSPQSFTDDKPPSKEWLEYQPLAKADTDPTLDTVLVVDCSRVKQVQKRAPDAEIRILDEIRRIRNERLAETDWTQVADVPLTSEQVFAYQAYRQALRDITNNVTEASFVRDVVWPVKPG